MMMERFHRRVGSIDARPGQIFKGQARRDLRETGGRQPAGHHRRRKLTLRSRAARSPLHEAVVSGDATPAVTRCQPALQV